MVTQPLQNLTSGKELWLLGEPALDGINMALQLISYDVAFFLFATSQPKENFLETFALEI